MLLDFEGYRWVSLLPARPSVLVGLYWPITSFVSAIALQHWEASSSLLTSLRKAKCELPSGWNFPFFVYYLLFCNLSTWFTQQAYNTCNAYSTMVYFSCRGVCSQPMCYSIIMEYCPYGQLYEVLRDHREVPPQLLYSWASQIACGMNYLHANKIIHRDLKSPK